MRIIPIKTQHYRPRKVARELFGIYLEEAGSANADLQGVLPEGYSNCMGTRLTKGHGHK